MNMTASIAHAANNETVISLLDPVKTYTAKELAAMPLSKMNEAIAAQESYFMLEHLSKMGGGCDSLKKKNAGRISTDSGQRKIENTLQDRKPIYRTSYRAPVRETWPCKIGGVA